MKFLNRFVLAGLFMFSSQAMALPILGAKQGDVCQISNVNELDSCKVGEVLVFTPTLYGNEQLPIIVAGFACDFNFPIVHNVGGVSCIFTDARKDYW
ncbi:MAG: hypothetical protein IBX55_16740 [Methyloprofundus sp.]|nr:hypothetical protein [Methyloprofundus sp.]